MSFSSSDVDVGGEYVSSPLLVFTPIATPIAMYSRKNTKYMPML
jgi:hypothetical protein